MSRILLLTHEFPPFLGGIGTYACQLATAAHGAGHEVTVIAPDYGSDLARADRARYPFRVDRFRGGRYAERCLPGLVILNRRHVMGGKYDIVHAVDWPNILALGLLNKVRRVPFLATVYGTEILGSARSRLVGLLRSRRVFESAEKILAISDFTRDLLLTHFPGVDSGRVAVTPLGVSPFWFEEPTAWRSLREETGIPAGQRIILTASRLDPRKGHRLALRAMALLPRDVKADLAYVIVGEGDDQGYLGELRTLAGESGVRVVFAGGVSDESLRGFYAMASVFCMPGEPHPKKVEGFGLVFLEAAAQGLPSIACDVGAVSEVVRHERTGLIVPPMDAQALADALARLLDDESLRARLGREAHAVASRYSWGRCAELTYGPALQIREASPSSTPTGRPLSHAEA
jgi:phosphatidylinositol alpha-1,6-mannosyltransferase